MKSLVSKASLLSFCLTLLIFSACNLQTEKISSFLQQSTGPLDDIQARPFPEITTGIKWVHIEEPYSRIEVTDKKIFARPTIIPAKSQITEVKGSQLIAYIKKGIDNKTIKVEEIVEINDPPRLRVSERLTEPYMGNRNVVITREYKPVLIMPGTIMKSSSPFVLQRTYEDLSFDLTITHPRVPDRTNPLPTESEHYKTSLGYICPVVIKDGNEYKMWYTELNALYDRTNDYTNCFDFYRYEYLPQYAYSSTSQFSWTPGTGSDAFNRGLTPGDSSKLADQGGVVISNVIKTTDYYYLWYTAKDSKSYNYSGTFERKNPLHGDTWMLFSARMDTNSLQEWKRKDMGNLLLALKTGDSGFDSYSIHKCSVLYDREDLSFKFWYTGSNGNSLNIGRATSYNGLTGGNKDKEKRIYVGRTDRFDDRDIADPFIIKEGDLYKMWYSGYDGSKWRIGLAYSWDGLNFTYYDENDYKPLELSGEHGDPAVNYRFPCVVEEDNGNYLIFYSKQDRDGIWRIETSRSIKVQYNNIK